MMMRKMTMSMRNFQTDKMLKCSVLLLCFNFQLNKKLKCNLCITILLRLELEPELELFK